MGAFRFLPSTTWTKLALAGAITLMYIIGSTVCMQYGSSVFPALQARPPDLGHTETASSTEETEHGSLPGIEASRVLLVSSFYPLNDSEISQQDYDVWLYNYLGIVKTDIYIYTTTEQAERVRSFRPEGMKMTVDTTFTSIFDVPPLKGKVGAYISMNIRDGRTRPRHSIESYAVLNSKPFFLTNAVKVSEANGLNYNYAFWNDALSFHDEHEFRRWPSTRRLDELWATGSDITGTDPTGLLFIPTWKLPAPSLYQWSDWHGPIRYYKFNEGSFFGGHPNAVDWLARAFYTYHDAWLEWDLFVGQDDIILNALSFLFASRISTVWYNDPAAPARAALNRTLPWPLFRDPRLPSDQPSALGQCDSEWFYYRFFLADEREREMMRAIWVAEAKRWRWWGWWRPRDTTPCELTRLVPMLGTLRRNFGEGWSLSPRIQVPDAIHWPRSDPDNVTQTTQ